MRTDYFVLLHHTAGCRGRELPGSRVPSWHAPTAPRATKSSRKNRLEAGILSAIAGFVSHWLLGPEKFSCVLSSGSNPSHRDNQCCVNKSEFFGAIEALRESLCPVHLNTTK